VQTSTQRKSWLQALHRASGWATVEAFARRSATVADSRDLLEKGQLSGDAQKKANLYGRTKGEDPSLLAAYFPAEVVHLGAGNPDVHKLADRGAGREQHAGVHFWCISFGPSDQWLLNERFYPPANHRLG
jgi:hypothetical protein